MTDSATIELFRDCATQGVKRLTCTGKQDQDYIQRELICKSEEGKADTDVLIALNTGALHIFGNTPSDNRENNNIDRFAVKNFNELMMDDQAFEHKDYSLNIKNEEADNVKIPSEAPSKNLFVQDIVGTLVLESNADSSTKTRLHRTSSPEARSRRETENPTLSQIDNATALTEPSSSVNSHKSDVHNSSNSQDHFVPPMLLVHHDNSTQKPSDIMNRTNEAIQTTQDSTLLKEIISNRSSSIKGISTSFYTEEATEPTKTSIVPITIVPQIPNEYLKSKWGRPHAPKFGGEISFHAPILSTMKATIELTNESVSFVNDKLNSTVSTSIPDNLDMHNETSTIRTPPEINDATATATIDEASSIEVDTVEITKRSNRIIIPNKHQHKDCGDENMDASQHADFTNANVNFQRYKPNRHRILTKPETHTYIQKIFG